MKKITENNLVYELKIHAYGSTGKYDVSKLFNIYTATEIQKFSDLFEESIQTDFMAFINDNMHLMKGLEKDESGEISEEEKNYVRSIAHKKSLPLILLTNKFFSANRKNQEHFVQLVEHIVGKQKPAIMDIGSGQVPYSSFILAKDNVGKISAMDKFAISNTSIKNLDVTPHNQYFTEKTIIKKYDLVVANRACSAIPNIVSSCVKQKRPYFLRLCPCEAPGNTIEGWKEFLPTLDKNISFEGKDFAMNLDL